MIKVKTRITCRCIEDVDTGHIVFSRHEDHCVDAIVRAFRWVESLSVSELDGDDSVGWWLLVKHGRSLPAKIAVAMEKQLAGLLNRLRFGSSNIYTATALARTLSRSGALDNKNAVQTAFITAIQGTSDNDIKDAHIFRDIIWLLQAIYETGDSIRPVLSMHILKVLMECELWSQVMILPILAQALEAEAREVYQSNLRGFITNACQNLECADRLHWEVSYLLLASLRLDMIDEGEKIANFLLTAQNDSQWDEETDENIESTALVALALGEYWNHYGKTRDFLQKELLSFVVRDRLFQKQSLEDAWQDVRRANQKERGRALEDFIERYCNSDANLSVSKRDHRTKSEEVDIVLINKEQSRFFERLESDLIMIECKCTKIKTSASELRDFTTKVRNRVQKLCKVGIMVSFSGFSSAVRTELARHQKDDPIIGIISGQDIVRGISENASFSDLIQKALRDAILL